MEGNILDNLAKSGVYTCKACETLSVHITGFSKEPCSECGSNSNWIVKNKTISETKKKDVYKYRYKCR